MLIKGVALRLIWGLLISGFVWYAMSDPMTIFKAALWGIMVGMWFTELCVYILLKMGVKLW